MSYYEQLHSKKNNGLRGRMVQPELPISDMVETQRVLTEINAAPLAGALVASERLPGTSLGNFTAIDAPFPVVGTAMETSTQPPRVRPSM